MAIRWDKFTVKAQEAVQRANELAAEHGNPELQPLHLLGALLEDKEGIVPPVLEKIGIGPQAVLSEVYRELEKLPKVSGQSAQPALSSETNNLLEQAFKVVGLDWRDHVVVDPLFYRPAEVDLLLADPDKARVRLGWEPEVSFEQLVKVMVDADLEHLRGMQATGKSGALPVASPRAA